MTTAYHCTRLTDEQIGDLLATGLVPLAASDLTARVRRLRDVGEITDVIADRLLANHYAHCENRAGLIAFVHKKSDLRDEAGVGYLLSHWGGEALTMWHAADPVTGPILRRIGTPCIIEVRLRRDQILPGGGTMKTDKPVPPGQIAALHKHGDTSFEALTKYNFWHWHCLDDTAHMASHWPHG